MAGGVGLYLAKYLKSHLSTPRVESCWIEYETSKTNSIIVGCICRHPHANLNDFTVELETNIKEFNNTRQTVYILGDFIYFFNIHIVIGIILNLIRKITFMI